MKRLREYYQYKIILSFVLIGTLSCGGKSNQAPGSSPAPSGAPVIAPGTAKPISELPAIPPGNNPSVPTSLDYFKNYLADGGVGSDVDSIVANDFKYVYFRKITTTQNKITPDLGSIRAWLSFTYPKTNNKIDRKYSNGLLSGSLPENRNFSSLEDVRSFLTEIVLNEEFVDDYRIFSNKIFIVSHRHEEGMIEEYFINLNYPLQANPYLIKQFDIEKKEIQWIYLDYHGSRPKNY